MRLAGRLLKIIIFPSIYLLGACSPSQPQSAQTPAYVTNAEHILKVLTVDKSTAVSFFMRPVRSTACEYMFVEIGRKAENGQYETTNVLYPGRDRRDNFGQDQLENQLQFLEVDKPGEYGITAWGCKPYNLDMEGTVGLIATFDVAYGKLNYIGELGYSEGAQNIMIFEVGDRTEFALSQIRAQLPELEPYFQTSLMEKYVLKLTEEQKAELEKIQQSMVESQSYRRRLEALDNNAKYVNDQIAGLKAVYGHISDENWPEDKLRKFKSLQWRQVQNNETILRLNYFITSGKSQTVIDGYLSLREKSISAREEFEDYRIRNNISPKFDLNAKRSETYLTLQSNWLEAERSVKQYIEEHS